MNRIDFEGRVTRVTGAANGIHLSTAARIIASCGQGVLRDADGSAIESALAKLEASAHGRIVELADEMSVEAETIEAEDIADKIDILANNVGITAGSGKTWELGPDIWRRTIEINRVASYVTSRAVGPRMLTKIPLNRLLKATETAAMVIWLN